MEKLIVTVTKQFSFCYGHRLPGYEGKCCQQHGHNAVLEVTVGPSPFKEKDQFTPMPKEYPGMVMDFHTIKEAVAPILEEVDHKNLNDIVSSVSMYPTCENLAEYLFRRIDFALGYRLVKLRLSETPTSWAEVTRSGVAVARDL